MVLFSILSVPKFQMPPPWASNPFVDPTALPEMRESRIVPSAIKRAPPSPPSPVELAEKMHPVMSVWYSLKTAPAMPSVGMAVARESAAQQRKRVVRENSAAVVRRVCRENAIGHRDRDAPRSVKRAAQSKTGSGVARERTTTEIERRTRIINCAAGSVRRGVIRKNASDNVGSSARDKQRPAAAKSVL